MKEDANESIIKRRYSIAKFAKCMFCRYTYITDALNWYK